jgi:hypothetical protein
MTDARRHAQRALAARADRGKPLMLWWRDDDAVTASAALDRLLDMTGTSALPLALAVIPAPWDQEPTGTDLVQVLDDRPHVHVVVHGWSHRNHAGKGKKKQELTPERSIDDMRAELRRGLAHLRALHPARFLPLLVPPWNRIAPDLLPFLAEDGFTALSCFGAEQPVTGLRVINTQIDVIDWGSGPRAKDRDHLWRQLADLAASDRPHAGLLTHHLVHDKATWDFLDDLVAICRDQGAEWRSLTQLRTT